VAPDWANRPVNYVSFSDAARFCNWLHNGQPTGAQGPGTTEDGAYTGIGDAATLRRESDARFFIPDEDEWYKAAYYVGGGLDAGYWAIPMQTSDFPRREPPPGTDLVAGSGNFRTGRTYAVGPPYYRTEVGAYTAKPSVGAYGTYDQGGNVEEFVEAFFDGRPITRGGSYLLQMHDMAYFSWHASGSMNAGSDDNGFRIAAPAESPAIPEPASLGLLGFGAGLLLRRRRRSGRS
jgi:hypothetical protein